jgi:hypothetical protein
MRRAAGRAGGLLAATLLLGVAGVAGPAGATGGSHGVKRRAPDLRIGSVTLRTPTVATDGQLVVVAKVVNAGRRAAKPFVVALTVRGVGGELGSSALRRLRRGRSASVTLRLELHLTPVGTHSVRVCADAGRAVHERRERNNCRAAGGLVVSSPLPPPPPVNPATGVCAGTVTTPAPASLRVPAGATCVVPAGVTITSGATVEPGGTLEVQGGAISGSVNLQAQATLRLSSGTVGSVTVGNAATATILGGSVGGDVTASVGGTIDLEDGAVGHNVTAGPGSTLILRGGTVSHDVAATAPSGIAVGAPGKRVNVVHNMTISGLAGGSANSICALDVGRSLSISGGQAAAGPLVIGDTADACAAAGSITVQRDATVANNAHAVDFSENRVGYNLTVTGNSPGGATVRGNEVGHTINCLNNVPLTASDNLAGYGVCG